MTKGLFVLILAMVSVVGCGKSKEQKFLEKQASVQMQAQRKQYSIELKRLDALLAKADVSAKECETGKLPAEFCAQGMPLLKQGVAKTERERKAVLEKLSELE